MPAKTEIKEVDDEALINNGDSKSTSKKVVDTLANALAIAITGCLIALVIAGTIVVVRRWLA